MNNTALYVAVFAVVITVVLFALLFRLFRLVRSLNNSFAKLGYIAREDAKKYFGDAADKVVDMNTGFNAQYQAMIEQAMKKAMSESSSVVEATLAKAEQEATNVVIKAQTQANEILEEARKDAGRFSERAVSGAVDAISWSLQEYIHNDLSVAEHEAIIMQLIEKYVNERRT